MEVKQLSKQTKMAMMSQFLGFMLDGSGAGHGASPGQDFRVTKRHLSLAAHSNCVHVLHHDGSSANRLSDIRTLCRPNRQAVSVGHDDRRRGCNVALRRLFSNCAGGSLGIRDLLCASSVHGGLLRWRMRGRPHVRERIRSSPESFSSPITRCTDSCLTSSR